MNIASADILAKLNTYYHESIEQNPNKTLSDEQKERICDIFASVDTVEPEELDFLVKRLSTDPQIASIVNTALTGTGHNALIGKLAAAFVDDLAFFYHDTHCFKERFWNVNSGQTQWFNANQARLTEEGIKNLPEDSKLYLTALLANVPDDLKEWSRKVLQSLNSDHLEFFRSPESANINELLSRLNGDLKDRFKLVAIHLSINQVNIKEFINNPNRDQVIPHLKYGGIEDIKNQNIIKELLNKFANVNFIKISRCNIKELTLPAMCPNLVLWDCDFLKTLNAPNARRVDINCCGEITINVPNATTVRCNVCKMTALDAPNATTVDVSFCYSVKTVNAPNAIKVNCRACENLEVLSAPNATEVNCADIKTLTTLNLPEAIKVDCSDCPALIALSAPKAITVMDNDTPNLKIIYAPLTGKESRIGECIFFKMPKARLSNDPELYNEIYSILDSEREHLPEQFKELIDESAFKSKLLAGSNMSSFIDPMRERLNDPNEVEKVVGELSSLSKWASEVEGHEHLSQWLFNLKEEIRHSIEAIHTNTTFRLLMNEHYHQVREDQNSQIQEGRSELNLGLFLDNKKLRERMRVLLNNVPMENLNELKRNFESALNKQLPLLYPNEPDHSIRQKKILSFIDRIQRTKDFNIDTEGVSKHLIAIINSVCIFNSQAGIKHNAAYITAILDAIYEGAEACENRAADAFYKAEMVFFEDKFKHDKTLLYGVVLMQWKRLFIEQYVRQFTLPQILSDLEGSRMVDIEIIMANFQVFDALLDLNLDIKDVLHLDDIKAHLTRLGKSDNVIADPQKLFNALMEPQSQEFWLDLFFHSPVIQKLHVVDPNFYHEPQHVREEVGALLMSWGKATIDKSADASIPFDQLKTILNRYSNIKDFTELESQFNADIKALTNLYSNENYDDELEVQIIDRIAINLSNAQDSYRRDIFDNLKDRIKQDLIEIGYLVMPQSIGGRLVLDYPDPVNLNVDPHAVIDAHLALNVQDWPREFQDSS